MLIKVLQTIKGAEDSQGIKIKEYKEGQTYDIFEELAQVFLREGWGVEEKAIEEVNEEVIEEKAIEDLENKAIDNLENKKFKKGKK